MMKRTITAAALSAALLLGAAPLPAHAAEQDAPEDDALWAGSEYWVDSDYLPVARSQVTEAEWANSLRAAQPRRAPEESGADSGSGNSASGDGDGTDLDAGNGAGASSGEREIPQAVPDASAVDIADVGDAADTGAAVRTETPPEAPDEALAESLRQGAALLEAVNGPAALREAAETPIDEYTALLSPGAALREKTYWTGRDYRTEHYIELSAGTALRPVVVSGDPLTKTDTLPGMAAALEAQGLHAVAGINGGFFTVATGVPVGIVVRDGAVRADDDGLSAIGFRRDGSALIGTPQLSLTLETAMGDIAVQRLNRERGDALTLYTADFGGATVADGPGLNLICVPEGGSAVPLSGSVTLRVEELVSAEGPIAIPEGRMVLSQADMLGGAWMSAVVPGERLTLRSACAPGWEDVESAVCLLHPLVENGEIVEGLETYPGPRSAVGVRADGSVVLYTVDGRQNGYSVGAGLEAVARRLRELGCVSAGALDGGGSTLMDAVLPGDAGLSEINRPSGGVPRKVVNYIFLVDGATASGQAARLALYPLDVDAVAGAEVPLTLKAVDANGYPAPLPDPVYYSVSDGLGRVENGVFHATGSGSGTITAAAPGVAAVSIPVSVTDAPDELALYGEVYGKHTRSLTLAPDEEMDLTVRAWKNHVQLSAQDENFQWELTGAAGTVDAGGHLVPARATGTGTLRVSLGGAAEEIPVKVWTGIPFGDVSVDDAYFEAVRYVYEHGLFDGVEDTVFAPDTVFNRAMLVKVLWEMSGAPQAAGSPAFEDVSADDWFAPAVAWGVEQGVIEGFSDTRFGPLETLTKEQILTILWRYAGRPGALQQTEKPEAEQPEAAAPESEAAQAGDTAAEHADTPLPVLDAGSESPYAREAIRWALASPTPLITLDAGRVLPAEPMSRAAVAEVLTRWCSAWGT